MLRFVMCLAAAVVLCRSAPLAAQEPINAADSATQPSPGHAIFKEQFRYYSLDLRDGPRDRRGDIQDSVFQSTLNIGLLKDVMLSLRAPTVLRDRDFDGMRGDDDAEGVGDLTALAKWRIYRNDSAALDSARLSLLGGAVIRTGDGPFTSDAYNPVLGAAYTQIRGRHGINASLQWTFTTDGNREPIYAGESTADVLRHDLAYLYRLWPAEYTAETHGAFYAVMELNGLYETNGDHEILLSPGLMYEAATWTAELSVQLPALQEISHRAEMDFAVVAGVRFAW